jgi:hypothetical protein
MERIPGGLGDTSCSPAPVGHGELRGDGEDRVEQGALHQESFVGFFIPLYGHSFAGNHLKICYFSLFERISAPKGMSPSLASLKC